MSQQLSKPKMKDAYYFPHFCNARHDRKIKRIRKELGVEGYGIYFLILEVLREQSEYKYPIEDIDLLADEFGTSEQKINTVIFNYNLFNQDDSKNFYSSNLILYLQPYLEGKEKKRIAGIKGNLIRYKYYTKEQLQGKSNRDILLLAKEIEGFSQCDSHGESLSDALAIPMKRNENKEMKIKEIKEIKENSDSFVDPSFSNQDFQPSAYIPPEKRESQDPPKKLDQLIQSAIDHWKTKSNLPECRYLVINLPKIPEVIPKFDVYSIQEILKAIDNLSSMYDELDPKYRPKNFHNFFANDSIDNWVDSANPLEAFKKEFLDENMNRDELDAMYSFYKQHDRECKSWEELKDFMSIDSFNQEVAQ